MTIVAASPPVLKRHLTAAVLGNALEVYDFIIYGTFAVQLGHAFFPNKSAFISLILSLSTFGAGFLLRPVGAAVIGRYADRVGRRPAMLLTFGLMGVSILGLALTPSFAQIGVAAPVLALVWRLLQGIAFGGEIGPTTAYLVEAAPPEKRGLYAAWQGASQGLAFAAGGVVGWSVANLAGPASLESWGWRLAFGLGALVLPVGLWLRSNLPETLGRPEEGPRAHPAQAKFRGHLRIFLIGLGLIMSGTVTTYVLNFMTTFAITTLHTPAKVSLGVPIVIGATTFAFNLIGGPLSDRLGRKPFIVGTRIALAAVTVPLFWLVVRHPDPANLMAAAAVLGAILGLSSAAMYAGLNESMHREIRGVGFGAVYALSVAIFGGATQPFVAWMIHLTGDPLAPAWTLAAANAISLVAAFAYRESAPALLTKRIA